MASTPATCSTWADEAAMAAFKQCRFCEAETRYGKSKVYLDVANEEFFKVWYLQEMTPRSVLAKGLVEGMVNPHTTFSNRDSQYHNPSPAFTST